MNKLTFILISATFIIMTTLVVNSLGLGTIDSDVGQMPGDVDDSVGSILSILDTFVNLLTFQLDTVPLFFNLIFSVIAIGIGYVLATIIMNLIPFT